MNSATWLKRLQQERAIAVIRSSDYAIGLEMVKAVHAGGINLIEITWNSDRPAQLIETLRQTLPNATIGVGTITSPTELQAALAIGVEFIFTPGTDPGCIQAAVDHNIPIVPGALTPTEIVQAWNAGASCVKVFPVHALGGATYIQSLHAPLRQIPLIPTGGITLENAPTMLAAGAIAVGLAGDLFPSAAIASGQWQIVTQQAQQLIAKLRPYRQ